LNAPAGECQILVLRYGPWRLMVNEDGACWLEPPRDQRIGAGTLPTHEELIEAINAWTYSQAAADLRDLGIDYEAAVHRFKIGCKAMSEKAHGQRRKRTGGIANRIIHWWRERRLEDRTLAQVREILRKDAEERR